MLICKSFLFSYNLPFMFFYCEPGYSNAIKRPLRRTLVRQECYWASYEF